MSRVEHHEKADQEGAKNESAAACVYPEPPDNRAYGIFG